MTETARKKKHCVIEQGVGEPGRLDSNWVSLEQQEKMGEGMEGLPKEQVVVHLTGQRILGASGIRRKG